MSLPQPQSPPVHYTPPLLTSGFLNCARGGGTRPVRKDEPCQTKPKTHRLKVRNHLHTKHHVTHCASPHKLHAMQFSGRNPSVHNKLHMSSDNTNQGMGQKPFCRSQKGPLWKSICKINFQPRFIEGCTGRHAGTCDGSCSSHGHNLKTYCSRAPTEL